MITHIRWKLRDPNRAADMGKLPDELVCKPDVGDRVRIGEDDRYFTIVNITHCQDERLYHVAGEDQPRREVTTYLELEVR